jgi:hypothetical protein
MAIAAKAPFGIVTDWLWGMQKTPRGARHVDHDSAPQYLDPLHGAVFFHTRP